MQRKSSISDFYPGDLAIFAPVSWRYSPLGWAIGHTVSAATWPWDLGFQACHVGLVAPYGKRLAIYESTIDRGLGPCLHTGELFARGVQVHSLEDRLKLHLGPRGGQVWRLPLRSTKRLHSLTLWAREAELRDACVADLGRPYDALGALQARFFGLGWTRRYRRARTDANRAFFCSEWAAKIYQDMGWLGDVIPSHENPKSLVRLLVDRGICGPPEEITP